MTELRLNGKTPDGANLSLIDHDGSEYFLRISDTLRASVNQPRLTPVSTEDEVILTVKEIQARLRSGETIEGLAREAKWTMEKVERFAGPILQERSYIIGLAQDVILRRESGREPLTFFEVVATRLAPRQVDMGAVEWICWRLENGTWVIRISYPSRDGKGIADWNFDGTRRALSALDDTARWIVGDESGLRERSTTDHGLVYGNHPAGRQVEPKSVNDFREPPRLVSIRELPDADAVSDGVTSRAKVPSWDEIMFGGPKQSDEDLEI